MKLKFVNSEGKTVMLDGKLKIPDLIKLGVKEISFSPMEEPQPKDPRWFWHKNHRPKPSRTKRAGK